ncbi:MAG: MotA/TolQ/ExbB proton channel family protein [Betaproteobacteria bacterium]|jgi:biopolymer transport protein ExbB|nr:MotA/TolQ/ExbB proton channel family protein [Betaproteobacteria bacterium]NBS45637.1 MotA/TolQ/ExbB proton channel family protein [Betaproteobacteria bacterium]
MEFLHDLTFALLYASLVIAAWVSIERTIFFTAARRDLRALAAGVTVHGTEKPATGKLARQVLACFASVDGSPARSTEHAIDKAFIETQGQFQRRLWVLDTIVTAAPLLGLLGTILGIFETFTALAKSGISDAQGVSAGIGAALLATALGIGVALVCLVINNAFTAWVESLSEDCKLALMELGARPH